MNLRDALFNLKDVYGFKYFYAGQEQIIKANNIGDDIVCCAPPNAGVRTAILANSINSKRQCIFIIRSIAEIQSLANLISDTCKSNVASITSHIKLEDRHSKIVDFLNQEYQFLLTTPDQFALISTHSPKLYSLSNDLLVIVYNAERIFPESYRYHASYSSAFKLINTLKSALDSSSPLSSGRFTTLYVSDCLSIDAFKQLNHSARPPATHIHFQREIRVPIKTVRTNTVDEFAYMPASINDSKASFVIIVVRKDKLDAVSSVLINLRMAIHYNVISHTHSAPAKLPEAPTILITESINTIQQHKFGLCIIHGVPDNTSQIAFILNAAKVHSTQLLFGYPFLDDIAINSIATLTPPPALLTNTIAFLKGRSLGSTVSRSDVTKASSKDLSSTALDHFLNWLISQNYLKLIKGSGKGSSKNKQPEIFEIKLLPSYELLLDIVTRNHSRAIRRHNDALALLTSSRCKQQAFNELNGAIANPLACGICNICKPLDHFLPTLAEVFDELRKDLITLRNIAAETTQLPAAVLLPNAAIEQIIESRPTSMTEICKLEAFKGNERHLLFGDDILRLLNAKLSNFLSQS